MKGDGFPDIVGVNQFTANPSLYILLNNGKGQFAETAIPLGTLCYGPLAPVIGDVNGDGSLDITLGCSLGNALIFLNNGQGTFTYSQTLTGGALNNGPLPLVGDLNGDGIPDIALLESNTIGVYIGMGGGAFAPPLYFGAGPLPGYPILANLHGQPQAAGRPNIVVPDATGRVLTVLNATKA